MATAGYYASTILGQRHHVSGLGVLVIVLVGIIVFTFVVAMRLVFGRKR